MWKGGISFGLVMIPVRLYAATEQKDIAFRQVHRADGGRIRFRRFCSVDGEEVPYEDVVKGYELPTGEMVILDDEDLADLPLPTTKSIEVLHFAPAEQLDPILFNRSYYVEPEVAGARAYVLLRDALEQSGRIAIAQVALRQRESLATLRSRDGVLVLETLLWPDEVRNADFPFLDQDVEVRPQELTMAASLIDSMTPRSRAGNSLSQAHWKSQPLRRPASPTRSGRAWWRLSNRPAWARVSRRPRRSGMVRRP